MIEKRSRELGVLLESLLLGTVEETMLMEIIISVILLFAGIIVLTIIHVCIVGRAFRRGYEHSGLAQGNCSGTRMISNEDLKKLPCFEYMAAAADGWSGNSPAPVDCVVCLENFRMGDKCRLLPNCKHNNFHVQCIDSWLLTTPVCPICRTRVSPTKCGVMLKEESCSVSGDVGIQRT